MTDHKLVTVVQRSGEDPKPQTIPGSLHEPVQALYLQRPGDRSNMTYFDLAVVFRVWGQGIQIPVIEVREDGCEAVAPAGMSYLGAVAGGFGPLVHVFASRSS